VDHESGGIEKGIVLLETHSRSISTARATLLAAAFLLLSAGTSQAYTITQIGTTGGNPGGLPLYEVSGLVEGDIFVLDWTLDGSLYGDAYPTLSAIGSVTVTSLTATTVVLDITLENTTPPLLGDPDLTAAITVFGLGVLGIDLGNPGNMLSSAGSFFDTYGEGNIGGGLTIDVCASTNALCTTGQPFNGINIGESDSFQFTLQGTFDVNNLTLDSFGTKWQTNYSEIMPEFEGNNRSFELPGTPSNPIPEPSTASLVGLGLVGLGVLRRRARA
jgi:hypothetical protein